MTNGICKTLINYVTFNTNWTHIDVKPAVASNIGTWHGINITVDNHIHIEQFKITVLGVIMYFFRWQ